MWWGIALVAAESGLGGTGKRFDWSLVKELAEECRRQGIKLFLYYSQLEWRHPDYFPRGQTGATAGRPPTGEWARYLDYMDAQVTELLTGYGPIGGIWFDGMWDKPDAEWDYFQWTGGSQESLV